MAVPLTITVSSFPLSDSEKSACDTSRGTTPDVDVKEVPYLLKPQQLQCLEAQNTHPLPPKTQGKVTCNIRHKLLNLYRRLFCVVFLINVGLLAANSIFGFSTANASKALMANLFVSVMMRQEYVVNALFYLFTLPPPSWPLWFRLLCARVYHIGGLHSGCGVSSAMWLIVFTCKATQEFVSSRGISLATLSITYILLILLLIIVIFAHPALRARFHNTFEAIHRFLGWTAVGLTWALVILFANDHRAPEVPLSTCLVKSLEFWLLVILTASIVLPWLRLRKYPVQAEILSKHALQLHFDYVDQPAPGSFVRISDQPLLEWHAFATIAIPGVKGYTAIVSNAGDWTKRMITCPPQKLWVRGIPTLGVLRIVPMFQRVVIVATGSGIGPVAPHLLARRTSIKLIWTSPNVRETFGDQFVDMILKAAPDALIHDTRTHGKPDMVKLTYQVYEAYKAEAVAVISNPKLTYKLIYGLQSRGVPAFAPIFDS